MKTLEQLAFETVMPDGGETTEHQEAEIAALVKFGKLVLENASLPTKRAPDAAPLCPECGEPFDFCAMGHYNRP
jgi:hypothetical protein